MLFFITMVWLTGQVEGSVPWSLESLLKRATRVYIADYIGTEDGTVKLTVTEAVWGAKEDFPGVFRRVRGGSGYRGASRRFFVFDQVDLIGVEPKDVIKLGQGRLGQAGYCGWIRLPIKGEGAGALVVMPSSPWKKRLTLKGAKQLAQKILGGRHVAPGVAIVTTQDAPIYQGRKIVHRAKKGDRLRVSDIRRGWYCVAPSGGWIQKRYIEYRGEPRRHEPRRRSPSASALERTLDRFITYCELGGYYDLLSTYWHPEEKRSRCEDQMAGTLRGDAGSKLLAALRAAKTVTPELSEDGPRATFSKGQKRLVLEKDREGTWCLRLEETVGLSRELPQAPPK